jgi:hypothetical protein
MNVNSEHSLVKLVLTRRSVLAGAAGVALASRIAPAPAQDAATPVADQVVTVSDQTAELDGKDRIWQINRITAKADDPDTVRVRLGFVYAHEIPVTIQTGDETIDLAVGEGLAVQNRDDLTVLSPSGTVGSCHTLELIDPEDVDDDVNRHAIGAPFPTNDQDYLMTLYRGQATAGSSLSFGRADVQDLLLVLEGRLTYTRANGEATTLAAGEAASSVGGGEVQAGDDGDTTFLIVDLAADSGSAATPLGD